MLAADTVGISAFKSMTVAPCVAASATEISAVTIDEPAATVAVHPFGGSVRAAINDEQMPVRTAGVKYERLSEATIVTVAL